MATVVDLYASYPNVERSTREEKLGFMEVSVASASRIILGSEVEWTVTFENRCSISARFSSIRGVKVAILNALVVRGPLLLVNSWILLSAAFS